METNKVPTAEQFFKTDYKGDIIEFAKEFAKLHVKAALEAAFVKIKEDAMETYGSDVPDCWSDSSILNAYPKNLIK
jgi:hypothetical protein